MNESTIDVLSATIIVIVLICSGVVAGWVWGYQAAYRKIARDREGSFVVPCPCNHCEGTMFDHFHGCPIAAEFKLVTIAKPGG